MAAILAFELLTRRRLRAVLALHAARVDSGAAHPSFAANDIAEDSKAVLLGTWRGATKAGAANVKIATGAEVAAVAGTQRAEFIARRLATTFRDKLSTWGSGTRAAERLDARVDTISATETTVAFNHGQSAYRDDVDNTLQRWNATLDRRTCSQCSALDGVEIPITGSFPGGATPGLVHARCRCFLSFRRVSKRIAA